MNLHKVADGKYLHWPKDVGGRDRLWAGPGGVIDLSDPWVMEAIKGQEYKLVPAEAGLTPDELTNPQAIIRRRQRLETPKPKEPSKDVSEAAAEIPRPDPRPRTPVKTTSKG